MHDYVLYGIINIISYLGERTKEFAVVYLSIYNGNIQRFTTMAARESYHDSNKNARSVQCGLHRSQG